MQQRYPRLHVIEYLQAAFCPVLQNHVGAEGLRGVENVVFRLRACFRHNCVVEQALWIGLRHHLLGGPRDDEVHCEYRRCKTKDTTPSDVSSDWVIVG